MKFGSETRISHNKRAYVCVCARACMQARVHTHTYTELCVSNFLLTKDMSWKEKNISFCIGRRDLTTWPSGCIRVTQMVLC